MRILFTGATGFSGFHFAKSLAANGHEVICTLRRNAGDYTELRGQRVKGLQATVRLVEGITFGEPPFLRLISDLAPLDLLCHHAADVTNHRSPDFDPVRALQNNTHNLSGVLSTLKQEKVRAVVVTGTPYEPNEGKGDGNSEASLRAVSPYGLSKGLTWEMFRYYCETRDVALAKFVMPNPFGPWEDRGFTPYLMSTWRSGQAAQVKTPDYVRDNCHISLLARSYVAFVVRAASLTDAACIRSSPSGYVERQGEFTGRVSREVQKRTGWRCEFELLKQEDCSEPISRSNLEPAAPLFRDWNEAQAWDEFVAFYRH